MNVATFATGIGTGAVLGFPIGGPAGSLVGAVLGAAGAALAGGKSKFAALTDDEVLGLLCTAAYPSIVPTDPVKAASALAAAALKVPGAIEPQALAAEAERRGLAERVGQDGCTALLAPPRPVVQVKLPSAKTLAELVDTVNREPLAKPDLDEIVEQVTGGTAAGTPDPDVLGTAIRLRSVDIVDLQKLLCMAQTGRAIEGFDEEPDDAAAMQALLVTELARRNMGPVPSCDVFYPQKTSGFVLTEKPPAFPGAGAGSGSAGPTAKETAKLRSMPEPEFIALACDPPPGWEAALAAAAKQRGIFGLEKRCELAQLGKKSPTPGLSGLQIVRRRPAGYGCMGGFGTIFDDVLDRARGGAGGGADGNDALVDRYLAILPQLGTETLKWTLNELAAGRDWERDNRTEAAAIPVAKRTALIRAELARRGVGSGAGESPAVTAGATAPFPWKWVAVAGIVALTLGAGAAMYLKRRGTAR